MLDKAEISAGRMGKAFDLTNRFIVFAQSLPKRSRTTRRDTVKKRVCLQIHSKIFFPVVSQSVPVRGCQED